VDPSCPMCELAHEDIMHALVMCDYSQLVWHEFSLPVSSIAGHLVSIWFANILNVLSD